VRVIIVPPPVQEPVLTLVIAGAVEQLDVKVMEYALPALSAEVTFWSTPATAAHDVEEIFCDAEWFATAIIDAKA
jgi:hypothetical protein